MGELLWLDQLHLYAVQAIFGSENRSKAICLQEVTVGGRTFARGVAMRSNAAIAIELLNATRFEAYVGVDDALKNRHASLRFKVEGDGRLLWESGSDLRNGDAPLRIDIEIRDVSLLELVVEDSGDAWHTDHAVWGEARLTVEENRADAFRKYWLSDMQPAVVRPGYGMLRSDRAASGGPMRIHGKAYRRGIGVSGNSDLIYTFEKGKYARFLAEIGLDSESGEGTAQFSVFVDGILQYRSSGLTRTDEPRLVEIQLHGAGELRLVTAGDEVAADWANAFLSLAEQAVSGYRRGTEHFRIASSGMAIGLDDQANLVAIRDEYQADSRKAFGNVFGCVSLAGCRVEGGVTYERLDNGGVQFARLLTDRVTGTSCRLIERFVPDHAAVRWEIEIIGSGEPWSTSIETSLFWASGGRLGFWTAWGDPDMQSSEWKDPLESRSFRDLTLGYGGPYFREDDPKVGYSPFHPDVIAIPAATVLSPAFGRGISLVLSPDDDILDMSLRTSATGEMTFAHVNHRISERNPVRLTMHITVHEADWRGGIRWMAERYPACFRPNLQEAYAIAGGGAYSMHEGELDEMKLKRMGFKVNWKASLDFPYMGMFLPPVPDDEQWTRFNTDGSYAGDGNPDPERGEYAPASIGQLKRYAEQMRQAGFDVLSYFNVTEFGKQITGPQDVRLDRDHPELWKHANDFLFHRIADGILRWPQAANRPSAFIETWGWAIGMDPAGENYGNFLLEQAQAHSDRIPASAGICIDRMDWLRFYNDCADDGRSWRNNQAVRSLFLSWKQFMDKLGPLMHSRRKVIFCNNHVRRIDLLKQIDGLFGEFEYSGVAANLMAFCGLFMPAIGWVADEEDLKPDPDAFFQKYLYLGLHTMVPYPGNNHSITPKTEWGERQFLDYGPLMQALSGRRWVLIADAVEVAGKAAKANLFENGREYIVTVTFGSAETAEVIVRNLPELETADTFEICLLHPGKDQPILMKASVVERSLTLHIPLHRRCAVVRLGKGIC